MSASAPRELVRVKICGVKSVDDALVAVRAGADMVGLNFHPGSKRFVEPERAAAIAEAVPRDVWCVGVFVDLERREIEDIRGRVRLDAI
ncbi:MAG: phosphoribosylanthranilate isomerase, partial [Alphaproteobacteria bacterium]